MGCMLAVAPSFAQTTGGSFGSGGRDRGGSDTGSSDRGSKGSSSGRSSFGGSTSFGRSTSSGGSSSGSGTSSGGWAAAEEAARRRELAFLNSHRLAGASELLPEEQTRVQVVTVTKKPDRISKAHEDTDLAFRAFFSVILSGIVVIIASMALEKARSPLEKLTAVLPTRPRYATVRKVMLAFDWNARRALQGALKALAEEPMGTDRERRELVRALAEELQAHSRSVRYLKIVEAQGDAWEMDERVERETRQLRKRYTVETAGRARKQVEVFARPIEGNGLLVVSVLMLFEKKLELQHGWRPVDSVLRMLKTVPPVHRLEVVWSPSEDTDRLSSAELEVLYPELEPLDVVQVGRAACTQCGAVYALELGKCPSCGANEPARTKGPADPACPYCGASMPAHETQCRACNAFVNKPPAKA